MRRSVLMTRLLVSSARVGLTQDMHAPRRARAAFGVADDPAHSVARRHGAGRDQLFALLQGEVGHLSGRGVELVERALSEGVDLHGVDVARPGGLHSGAALAMAMRVCGSAASAGPKRAVAAGSGLSCPGSGRGWVTVITCAGLGGSCSTASVMGAGASSAMVGGL